MPKQALSDAALRSLQPPERGQLDIWDTSFPGFGVRLSQGGSKTFILNVDKVRRTIGRFPVLKLAQAREEARRILAERTLGKVRPQSITYEQAVKLFLEEKGERRRARTVKDHTRHLTLLGFKGQLADVTHVDLERKLKRLPPSEFNHRLACAKTFFTWAQKKRYREDNPTIGLSPHTRATRSRVLSDAELQLIWRACEQTAALACNSRHVGEHSDVGSRLPTHFATIVQLLILTGQRRGEIAALRADYCDLLAPNAPRLTANAVVGDQQCTITLPASLTKNRREHTFPIGLVASQLLTETMSTLLTNTDASCGSRLLFQARGKSSPFNGWGKSKAALDQLSGVSDWTLHDLRRTFATRLAELGVAPHVIERLLNHVTGTMSPLSRIYNRAQYMAEMKAAIDLWEAHLKAKVIT